MSRAETALKYFREQESETNHRVRHGIESCRKGDARITVRRRDGLPLPEGVTIAVKQTKHEFGFGANLFMLDEFESEEKNALYREKFGEMMNLATLPCYWDAQEPQKGQYRFAKDAPRLYRRPATELCLDYCAEKGIEPKVHCLNYDNARPKWLADPTIEEHKAALEERFRVLSERYAAVIPSWEVTNETFNIPFSREDLDAKGYSQFYRQREYNPWSFRMADRYFPNNRLIINDHLDFGCMRSLHGEFFGERSPYYLEIERMLREGVTHLDSIGFQYHCFFSKEKEAELAVTRYNPSHLFDVLDTYEKLGRRMQITEMTLSAFSNAAEDEEVHAELAKRLYSIFFSHPAMEAIVYWNLVDGYAVGATPGDMSRGENVFYGGLMRFDMSEKPAYKALRRLINEEWHTECAVPVRDGAAAFRGFYGDYALEVRVGGEVIPVKAALRRDAANNIVIEL